jgi:hypothetical protein
MNMMLMEKSRCMLSGSMLGHEFWVEAMSTACYLVNRSPSLALDGNTPHEVWTGKKHSLTQIKVFGCDSYVHIPKENKNKIDKRMKSVSLLGIKMV